VTTRPEIGTATDSPGRPLCGRLVTRDVLPLAAARSSGWRGEAELSAPVSSADTARGRSSGAHHPIDQLVGGLG
jgi:hypothetical protein